MKYDLKHEFDLFRALDPTAAQPLYKRDEMLDSQYRVLKHIILRLYEIAERERHFETKLSADRGAYLKHQFVRRPSQVFFIDGARGAGKTSILLTVKELLQYLGTGRAPPEPVKPDGYDPGALINEITDDLRKEAQKDPRVDKPRPNKYALESLYGGKINFYAGHKSAAEHRQTAVGLSIVHPDDLEDTQPAMEGVFARLQLLLEKEQEAREKKRVPSEEIRSIDYLIKRLSTEVAKGWYLARQSGIDAILRDSADYEDFLRQISKASQASHSRVEEWRGFVNTLLDTLRSELLVIFFDDADNRPAITRDILQTIRVFLDHPRIVTVLAGNLRSMRQSLMTQELQELSSAMGALRRSSPSTEREWRQLARRHTEEFLEKVLPRPTRFFLTLDDEDAEDDWRSDGQAKAKKHVRDEYERILGHTFDDYCALMLDVHRKSFLDLRWEAYQRDRAGSEQLPSDRDRDAAENYMSWWLLRHWYDEWLKPRSVRQLLALRSLTLVNHESPGLSDRLPSLHKKRLPVILFECPENYELIQKFTDQDASVLRWLHRQQIRSCWRGDRYFEINDVKHFSDSYAYRYLMYRLDLGIALPVSESLDDHLPVGLLPKPAGPNLRPHPPFFWRQRHPRLTGVARQLDHSLIPANCYYLFGANHLIDLAWADGSDRKSRPTRGSAFGGHRLILEWPDHLYFPDAETGSQSRPARTERMVRDYLTDIVIPLGSIQLGRYIEPSSAGAKDNTLKDVASGTLLSAEKKKKWRSLRAIAKIVQTSAKRIDYYDSLGPTSSAAHESRTAAEALFGPWLDLIKGLLPIDQKFERPLVPGAEPPKALIEELKGIADLVPSYRWLINDIRCSWHAARIYLTEIDGALVTFGTLPKEGDNEPESYSSRVRMVHPGFRYIVVSRASIGRWLGQGSKRQILGGIVAGWSQPTAAMEEWAKAVNSNKDSDLDDAKALATAIWPSKDNGRRARTYSNMPHALSLKVVELYVQAELLQLLRYQQQSVTVATRSTPYVLKVNKPHILSSADQTLLQDAKRREDDANWPLLIDPSVRLPPKLEHEDSDRVDRPERERQEQYEMERSRAIREAIKNRIARSHASFINALAPCLPSAIHLEVASILYAGRDSSPGDQVQEKPARILAGEALEDWRKLVVEFIRFILRYRALVEIDHLRMVIHQRQNDAQEADASSRTGNTGSMDRCKPSGLHLALAPDFAPATLGLIGLDCFGVDAKGTPTILSHVKPQLKAKGLEKRVLDLRENKAKTERASDTAPLGLLHDALLNLVECVNFIDAVHIELSGNGKNTGGKARQA